MSDIGERRCSKQAIAKRWRPSWPLAAAMLAAFAGMAAAAAAQTSNRPRAEDVNRGVVHIVTAGVQSGYARIGYDLSNVLDDGKTLRVVPILSKGSVGNLKDLLALRGVDIGIMQSDALAYAEQERIYAPSSGELSYITRLYNEEFHLIAGPEVQRLEDLEGKVVSFDVAGGGSNITTANVFRLSGVHVTPAYTDIQTALADLRAGRIAAIGHTVGKPYAALDGIERGSGLHFVPVPMTRALLEIYGPSELTDKDYPALVPPGQSVQTIAVGSVMAVYNLQPASERYRNIVHFVDEFFGNFDKLLQPGHHPKWAEVNLAATVPGWQRFPPAQAWLDANRQRPAPTVALSGSETPSLDDVLRQRLPNLTPDQKSRLVNDFQQWLGTHR